MKGTGEMKMRRVRGDVKGERRKGECHINEAIQIDRYLDNKGHRNIYIYTSK